MVADPWKLKGASLSIENTSKEYLVPIDYIMRWISVGRLEVRQGSVKGRPYTKILVGQFERVLIEDGYASILARHQMQKELNEVNKEILLLKKRLTVLQERKSSLTNSLESLINRAHN